MNLFYIRLVTQTVNSSKEDYESSELRDHIVLHSVWKFSISLLSGFYSWSGCVRGTKWSSVIYFEGPSFICGQVENSLQTH